MQEINAWLFRIVVIPHDFDILVFAVSRQDARDYIRAKWRGAEVHGGQRIVTYPQNPLLLCATTPAQQSRNREHNAT